MKKYYFFQVLISIVLLMTADVWADSQASLAQPDCGMKPGRHSNRAAWCFDPDWGLTLLKNFYGFKLTGNGEFFKEAMHRPPALASNKAKVP